jgi:methylmalonyl-CoA/ethylmalonyl-CoA epimerase
MTQRINHIAIAVEDLDKALGFWQDSLGLRAHRESVPEQQVDTAVLPLGEGAIELIQPVDADSGVARFLAKRGPGIHHICIEVDDIRSALADLKGRGVRLIDEAPRQRADGRLYAFVHPQSAQGVLVELYQLMTASG